MRSQNPARTKRHKSRGASRDDLVAVGSVEKIRYHPYGVLADVFTDRSDEILLAGPAGTGKSLGALHKIHLVLSKYKKSKGFMSRKTRASMTNSCMATYENLVLHEADRVHLHKQDQQYNYPNGSLLAIVGLDDPERIKSTEWDIGYVQEATECLENDWEIGTTRLRNHKVPYQQMLGDCNPDKPSHWLKKRCERGLTKMLNSFHEDNPTLYNHETGEWTENGKKYLAKLQRLSGVRYSRLFKGLWVAAEGVVYDKWDFTVHMISLLELPEGCEEWEHYWSIDWGYIHPACWQDWIEDPDTGQLYLVRQIYSTKMIVEDFAKEIMAIVQDSYVPRAIICDHDSGDRATFEKHTGLLTLPAYKDIQPGIKAVQARLRRDWPGGKPGLYIVRDCLVKKDDALEEEGLPTCTEDEMEGYVWDKNITRVSNSKKDELPMDKDNHGMDAMRYMIAFMDSLADDPQDQEGFMVNEEFIEISPY